MKVITSINNDYIKSLSSLNIKKYRDEQKKFIVEGYHLVKESMNEGLLLEVLSIDEKDEIPGIPFTKVTLDIIKKLANTSSPQNIIGICSFRKEKAITSNKILILDSLQDPGNFGTLVRSALNFNVRDIIISEDTVDLYNSKFIRATQGAFFKVNILKKDLSIMIDTLKENDYTVLGTDVNNGLPLKSLPKKEKYALILGSEGSGVKEELLSKTDYNITLETSKELDSLNVAIAGSIIMYYLQ